MRHIIKKQVLDFRLKNRPGLFTIQQQMVEYNKNVILIILERAMNELCREDELIQLDKLELDLGELAFRDLKEPTLSDRLYEKINHKVQQAIRSRDEQPVNIRRTKRTTGVARQWLFYMRQGYLAWDTIEINEAWYNDVLEAFAIDYDAVTDLRKLILGNPVALTRIVEQHADIFLVKITEILTAENQSEIIEAVNELSEIMLILHRHTGHRAAPPKVRLRAMQWERVLAMAAPAIGDLKTLHLASKILKRFINNAATAKVILKEISTHIRITKPFFVAMLGKDGISINDILQPDTNAIGDLQKTDQFNDRVESTTQKEEQRNAEMVNQEKDDTHDFDHPEDIVHSPESEEYELGHTSLVMEEIFTSNAGLVLLHPFLNSLFNKRKLVIENKFINRSAKHKAIHLLHYLATGRTEAAEFELVIPKLLCSYPLHAAIRKRVRLDPEDMNEANNLLEAAISKWTILKNSSVTALREGFLQRNGKFYVKNENMYLRIEGSSIDMLLDYLPWNLSIIKLPWMRRMVRVEWR